VDEVRTKRVEIGGMNCESCERLISNSVSACGGKVREISASNGYAVVEFPEGSEGKIGQAIEAAGYEVGGKPAESFEQQMAGFASDFIAGKPGVRLIRTCFTYSMLSFVALSLVALAWAGTSKYLPYFIYGIVSAASVAGALALFQAHRERFNCMEGMMIGMSIGMVAGFLFGAIAGATNGMFVGSVFGMAVGMALGAYAGKCCGIMGLMEGMMAGLMGGTMGAMLTVMMQFDHLGEFMLLFALSCLAILAGLKYMIHYYAGRRGEGELVGFPAFFSLALLLSLLTAAVVLYAPKTGAVI
jgi:copper chaperone CopZ